MATSRPLLVMKRKEPIRNSQAIPFLPAAIPRGSLLTSFMDCVQPLSSDTTRSGIYAPSGFSSLETSPDTFIEPEVEAKVLRSAESEHGRLAVNLQVGSEILRHIGTITIGGGAIITRAAVTTLTKLKRAHVTSHITRTRQL